MSGSEEPQQPQPQQQEDNEINNNNNQLVPIFLHPGPKRPAPKYVWLITHGASGPRITPQLLKEKGNLDADECHSTVDQAMTYTYLHLKKKARYTSIERFMANARSDGIVQASVFGYDAIASASYTQQYSSFQIEKHVVFKMLVRHIRENNASFLAITDGVNALTRGYLYKAVAGFLPPPAPDAAVPSKRRRDDLDRLPKKRLAELARTLRTENAGLKRRLDEGVGREQEEDRA